MHDEWSSIDGRTRYVITIIPLKTNTIDAKYQWLDPMAVSMCCVYIHSHCGAFYNLIIKGSAV